MDADRLPPQNLEAEVAVLGSMVMDPTCIIGVRGILRAEDFYSPDHQAIFAAVCDLAEAGRAIDLVTVVDRLRERKELERVGGADFLVSVLERTPSSALVLSHAQIVAERAARRRQIAGATQVMRLGYDLTSEPEVRAQAIQALAEAGLKPQGDFDLAAECLATDEEMFGGGHTPGWTTGNPELDAVTGGFLAGQCWTIGGRSQQCKTAMALNFVLGTMQGGGRACIFRYEERERAVYPKLTALVCGIPYAGIRTTNDDDRKLTFRQTQRGLGTMFGGLLRVYQGKRLPEVAAVLDREKPALVVYDTLQAMVEQCKARDGVERRDLEIARVSSFIQRSAKKYGHAAIMISQLVKGVMGLPTLRHLRESGAIEEDSDTILLLWWHWTESGNDTWQRELIVNAAKARETGFKGAIGIDIEPGTQKLGGRIDGARVKAIIREHGSNTGHGGGKKGWFGVPGSGGQGASEEV